MMTDPDWLVPGASVAILYTDWRHRDRTLISGVIDRVLKRDIVLESGERFRRTSWGISQPSQNTWAGWQKVLLPEGDPQVAAARLRGRRLRAESKAKRLIDGYFEESRRPYLQADRPRPTFAEVRDALRTVENLRELDETWEES